MIILASASPRRRELLNQIGVEFRVVVSEAEEVAAGDPVDVVRKNAANKAAAVAAREDLPVLAADTIVVCNKRIFGKPHNDNDAFSMLTFLNGRWHDVITGVALVAGGATFLSAVTTKVHVNKLSTEEIKAYVATGEPLGKAGAYAIQGRAAAFIDRIEGSYSNVVGLPLHEVRELAKSAGINLWP